MTLKEKLKNIKMPRLFEKSPYSEQIGDIRQEIKNTKKEILIVGLQQQLKELKERLETEKKDLASEKPTTKPKLNLEG